MFKQNTLDLKKQINNSTEKSAPLDLRSNNILPSPIPSSCEDFCDKLTATGLQEVIQSKREVAPGAETFFIKEFSDIRGLMNILPNEILVNIFSFFSLSELKKLKMLNRNINKFINDFFFKTDYVETIKNLLQEMKSWKRELLKVNDSNVQFFWENLTKIQNVNFNTLIATPFKGINSILEIMKKTSEYYRKGKNGKKVAIAKLPKEIEVLHNELILRRNKLLANAANLKNSMTGSLEDSQFLDTVKSINALDTLHNQNQNKQRAYLQLRKLHLIAKFKISIMMLSVFLFSCILVATIIKASMVSVTLPEGKEKKLLEIAIISAMLLIPPVAIFGFYLGYNLINRSCRQHRLDIEQASNNPNSFFSSTQQPKNLVTNSRDTVLLENNQTESSEKAKLLEIKNSNDSQERKLEIEIDITEETPLLKNK